MIKEMYQEPEMTIEYLMMEDVITASAMGNAGEDDWGNTDNSQDRDDFFQ